MSGSQVRATLDLHNARWTPQARGRERQRGFGCGSPAPYPSVSSGMSSSIPASRAWRFSARIAAADPNPAVLSRL